MRKEGSKILKNVSGRSTIGLKGGSYARKTNEAIETSVHENTVQIALSISMMSFCIQYI